MSIEMLPVQDPEDDVEVIEHAGTIVWNYYKSVGVQSKKGGAKNVTCFCDTAFTGCSSSRAIAHILGRPVLGQKKSNIKACVPIRKDDDNWHAQFKTAQKILKKKNGFQGSTAQFLESKAICFGFNISREKNYD